MRSRALYLCLLTVILALAVRSAAPEVSGPLPARPDEICVVCYGAVGSAGIAYLVDGVRYAVSKDEAPIFLSDPEGYAKRFDEHQRPKRSSLVMGGAGLAAVLVLLIAVARRRRARRAAIR